MSVRSPALLARRMLATAVGPVVLGPAVKARDTIAAALAKSPRGTSLTDKDVIQLVQTEMDAGDGHVTCTGDWWATYRGDGVWLVVSGPITSCSNVSAAWWVAGEPEPKIIPLSPVSASLMKQQ